MKRYIYKGKESPIKDVSPLCPYKDLMCSSKVFGSGFMTWTPVMEEVGQGHRWVSEF